MASPFIGVSPLSAGWSEKTAKGEVRNGAPGRSRRKPTGVVAVDAYIARLRVRDPRTGKRHDYRYRPERLEQAANDNVDDGRKRKKPRGPTHGVLHTKILLPAGASEAFRDPAHLWSEAERAELVKVRKTGEIRFRQGAELARRMVLAIPKELTLEENIELVEAFCRQFLEAGLAVRYAIHPSDNPRTGNIHAHLLITSRAIEGDRFSDHRCTFFRPDFGTRKDGKKAKRTFVSRQSEWPQVWAEVQNSFFVERGIPLEVDPISAAPRRHEGPRRPGQKNPKTADNKAIAEHEAKVFEDPVAFLQRISERLAVFSCRHLERPLRKAGKTDTEVRRIIQNALLHESVVALDVPLPAGFREKGGAKARLDRMRFTTKAVLEQERRLRENLRRLAGRAHPFPPDVVAVAEQLAKERGLDPEQVDAVRFCLQEGSPIPQTQGRAGTGKTYTSAVVHDALVASHYKVIGAAPTNAAVGVMRREGMKQAMTLHRLLGEFEGGTLKLDSLNVIVVDEAAMVEVGLYDRLLAAATRSGSRVMLIGDDRQLPPVGRGGAYSMIGRMYGQVALNTVRRQKVAWMREASQQLSHWDIGPAIQAYDKHGAITWTQSLEAATRRLVEDWGKACDETPGKTIFVYAGTNDAVNDLNRRLQQRRWRARKDLPAHPFTCCRYDVDVRVGERLQFHANDARKGIYNGTMATVTAIDAAGIHVNMDDGTETCFDPTTFPDWALGYAGTCYRGQGKTQDRVFLLYDHPFVWGAATTYVGLTRHREHAQLYIPRDLAADQKTLIRQMSRSTEQLLATDFVVADQERARLDIMRALYPVEPQVPLEIRIADGSRQEVDLAFEPHRRTAEDHFKRSEVGEFVSDYRKLGVLARSGPELGRAKTARRVAEGIAWRRGFKPSTGLVDPTCLQFSLLEKDREHLYVDPLDRLSGKEDGGIDLRTIAFQPDQVPYRPFMDMAWRIRQLDKFVQDAIIERLNKLGRMFGTDEALSAVLKFATYLVKISKSIHNGVRDKTWAKRRKDVRTEIAGDRLVWKPFMLLNARDERMEAPKRGHKNRAKARPAEVKHAVALATPQIEPALRPHRWESRADARSRQEANDGSAGGAREDARQAFGQEKSAGTTSSPSPML